MGKTIEVKEFDSIHKDAFQKTYPDWKESDFQQLLNLASDVSSSDEDGNVLDFIKPGKNWDTVAFKNYVGLIRINNKYQIQILPKIEFLDGEEDKTKQVFLKMLSCLKDFPCKIFANANLNVERMSLHEIFINMYIQEARRLVKQGIKSSYITQEDNLTTLKGKLLFNQHIKNNLVHKERFYTEFSEFHVNRSENRIIKSTLLKLQRMTGSFENSKEIRQLLTSFELVEPSSNYDKDFFQVCIDKSTKNYENLMKWSRVFLKNKSFTTFSGTESANALLFPMEKVFEAYIAQNMKRVFSNWTVAIQESQHYLFNKLNGDSYNKFALRPDIVVKLDNGHTIVMDTKWKRLINDRKKNYGISQADMYQMYAYAKKYDTSSVWLLYPMNSEMKSDEQICFESNDGVKVSLYFFDLAKSIDDSLRTLAQRISPV